MMAWFRSLIERGLPWYDVAAEREREEATADLERRLTRVLPKVASINAGYAAYGDRLERRKRPR